MKMGHSHISAYSSPNLAYVQCTCVVVQIVLTFKTDTGSLVMMSQNTDDIKDILDI